MNRLLILTGPSCVGKSPLHAALARLRPDLASQLHKVVLYNSRRPRPGERDGIDYHFRPRPEIERLRDRPGFTVMEVRGDLQAVSGDDLQQAMSAGRALFEGNPFVGSVLLQHAKNSDIQVSSLFMSPLSKEEIRFLRTVEPAISLPDFVSEVMRRKLLRRTQRQKGIPGASDLAEVERRATSAYSELALAWEFDHVLPNHDGEDSDHWDAFYYPIGDARRSVFAFEALLEDAEPPGVERWERDLLP